LNGAKYHIVGRYGGHKWHGFWLKVLDAREAFPLSTGFWLARLCSKHKSRRIQIIYTSDKNNLAIFLGSTNSLTWEY